MQLPAWIKRLLWHADYAQPAKLPKSTHRQNTRLAVNRFEERRVLDADFSLAGNVLTLSNFGGDSDVVVVEATAGTTYQFTLEKADGSDGGDWNGSEAGAILSSSDPIGDPTRQDVLTFTSGVVTDLVIVDDNYTVAATPDLTVRFGIPSSFANATVDLGQTNFEVAVVEQQGGGIITHAGMLNINATSASLTELNLLDTVNITTTGNAAITDVNSLNVNSVTADNFTVTAGTLPADTLTFGTVNVATDLNVTSPGVVTNTGTLTVGNVATFNDAASITLTQTDFNNLAVANAGTVSISETDTSGNDITIDTISATSVTITTANAASIKAAGNTTGVEISTTGSITLDSAGGIGDNRVDINSNGGDVSITSGTGSVNVAYRNAADSYSLKIDSSDLDSGSLSYESTSTGTVSLLASKFDNGNATITTAGDLSVDGPLNTNNNNLAINAAGDLTFNDNPINAGTGELGITAANILAVDTGGAAVEVIAKTLSLDAATVGAGGANVTFSDVETLTIVANGAVFMNEDATTFTTSVDITQANAAGTVDIDLLAADFIDIDAGHTLNSVVLPGDFTYTATTGDIVATKVTAGGGVTLTASAGKIDGGAPATDGINAGGDIQLTADTTIGTTNAVITNTTGADTTSATAAGDIELSSTTAAQFRAGVINTGGGDLTITSTDGINFLSGLGANVSAKNVTLISDNAITVEGGTLNQAAGSIATLKALNDAASIAIGSTGSDLDISTATLGIISATSDAIFVGKDSSNGSISVDANVNVTSALTLEAGTTALQASITTEDGFTLNGSNATLTVTGAQTITEQGNGNIQINDAIKLNQGAKLTLTTAAVPAVGAGSGPGNITVTGIINGTAGGAQEDLTITTGGSSGAVDLQSTVGGIAPVGDVKVNSNGTVDFGSTVTANSLDVTANGPVTVNDSVSVSGGTVADANTGVKVTGGGVVLGGDITTVDKNVFITGAITLTGSVSIDTGAATPGNVTIGNVDANAVANSHKLSIEAGLGTAKTGDLGSAVALSGGVDIKGGAVEVGSVDTSNSNVDGDGGAITLGDAGTGLVTIDGDLNSSATQGSANGGAITVNGAANLSDSGPSTDVTITASGIGGGSNGDVVFTGQVNTLDENFVIDTANNVTLNGVTTGGTNRDIEIGIPGGPTPITGELSLSGNYITNGGDASFFAADVQIQSPILVNTTGVLNDGDIEIEAGSFTAATPATQGGVFNAGAGDFSSTANINNLDHLNITAAAVSLDDTTLGDGSGAGGVALTVTTNTLTLTGDIQTTLEANAGGIDFSKATNILLADSDPANTIQILTNKGTGAAIELDTVNSLAAANALVLNAGDSSVTLGAVGATKALDELTITGSVITFNQDIGSGTAVANAGVTGKTKATSAGAVNFNGDLYNSGGGFDLNGNVFNVNAMGVTQFVSNGADITFMGGDINLGAGASLQIITNGSAPTMGDVVTQNINGDTAADVTINAGAANVSVGQIGVAGAGNHLDQVELTGATVNLAGSIFAGTKVDVNGNVVLEENIQISTTGGDVLFDTATGTIDSGSNGAKSLTINANGNVELGSVGTTSALTALTVSGSQITVAGNIGASTVNAGVTGQTRLVSTAATIFSGNVYNSGGGFDLDATGGFQINTGSNGDPQTVNFVSAAGNISFQLGDITLSEETSLDIALQGAGFVQVDNISGDAAGSGTVSISAAGNVTTQQIGSATKDDLDDVTLSGATVTLEGSVFSGGTVTVSGTLAIDADRTIAAGDATIAIVINNHIQLTDAATLTLDNCGAGSVTVSGNISGDAAGDRENLVVAGGNASVTLGTLGGSNTIGTAGTPFGEISIETQGAVTVNSEVSADSISISGAASDVTFDQKVTLDGKIGKTPDSLNINATNITFEELITVETGGGNVNLSGTGIGTQGTTFGGDVNLKAGIDVSAAAGGSITIDSTAGNSSREFSNVRVGGNLITRGGEITIGSKLRPTADVLLTTNPNNNEAGANILLMDVHGGQMLTINAGHSGNFTANGLIGIGTAVDGLEIVDANKVDTQGISTSNGLKSNSATFIDNGKISVQGDEAIIIADSDTDNSGTGNGVTSITLGEFNASGQDTTLIAADDIDLTDSLLVTSTGTLSIRGTTADTAIGFGSASQAGDGIQITADDINTHITLVSRLVLGSDIQEGDITLAEEADISISVNLDILAGQDAVGDSADVSIVNNVSTASLSPIGKRFTVDGGDDTVVTIAGGVTTSGGAITIDSPIVLNATGVTLKTDANGGSADVDLQSTVDATNATDSLIIEAGNGTVSVGDIGATTDVAGGVTITGGVLNLNVIKTESDSATDGDVTLTGSTINLSGDISTRDNTAGGANGGDVVITGATELQNSITVDTGDVGGGNIDFADAINATANQSLTLIAGAGDVTVTGDIGSGGANADQLGQFSVSSANNLSLQDVVTSDAGGSSGDILIGTSTRNIDGVFTLGGNMPGGDLTANGGEVQIFADAILLQESVSITSNNGLDSEVTISTPNFAAATPATTGLAVTAATGADRGEVNLNGTTVNGLDFFNVEAATVTLGQITLGDGSNADDIGGAEFTALDVNADNLTLTGDILTTAEANKAGAVDLSEAADIELNKTSSNVLSIIASANDDDGFISLGNVDSAIGNELILNAGDTEDVTLQTVGANNALASLMVDGLNINFEGDIGNGAAGVTGKTTAAALNDVKFSGDKFNSTGGFDLTASRYLLNAGSVATTTFLSGGNAGQDILFAGTAPGNGLITEFDSTGFENLKIDAGDGAVSVEDIGVPGVPDIFDVELAGQTVTLGGDMFVDGDVTVTGLAILNDTNVSINTSNDPVTFDGSIEAMALGAQSLSINAQNGIVTLGDAAGNDETGQTVALGGLTVSAGELIVNGNVSTDGSGLGVGNTGDIDFQNVGTLTLRPDSTLTFDTDSEASQNTNAGQVLITSSITANDVELTIDTTTSFGGVADAGTDANVDLAGAGSVNLESLTVNANTINIGNVNTFNDGVTPGSGDIELTATVAGGVAITFNGNLDTTGNVNAGEIKITTEPFATGLLRDDTEFNTDGVATDANITLDIAIDSEGIGANSEQNNFTLDAGSGVVDVNGDLGSAFNGELGLLTVNADIIAFGASIDSQGVRASGSTSIDLDAAMAETIDVGNVESFFQSAKIDSAGNTTVSGGNTVLTLRGNSAAEAINVGDGAAATNIITTAVVNAITTSVGELQIGHDESQTGANAAQTGAITFQNNATLTFQPDVVVQAKAAVVNIDEDIVANGDFTINGANADVNTDGVDNGVNVLRTLTINSSNQNDIAIHDNVNIANGNKLTLISDNGPGTGGDIAIDGDIRGAGSDLDIQGGPDSNVTIGNAADTSTNDAVGTLANRFGDVKVTGGAVTVESTVFAGSVEVTAGTANFNNKLTLNGAVGGLSLDVQGDTVTFGADADITVEAPGGDVSILGNGNATDSLTIASSLIETAGADILINDFDAGVELSADIKTTGALNTATVQILSDVVLQNSVEINTDNTALDATDGSNITLANVDSAAIGDTSILTVNAGAANVTTGNLGGVTAITGGVNLQGSAIDVQGGIKTSNLTGDSGNVNIDATTSVDVANSINTSAGDENVTGGDVDITGNGAATVNVQDITTQGDKAGSGAVTIVDTTTVQTGSITTAGISTDLSASKGGDVTFQNNTQVTVNGAAGINTSGVNADAGAVSFTDSGNVVVAGDITTSVAVNAVTESGKGGAVTANTNAVDFQGITTSGNGDVSGVVDIQTTGGITNMGVQVGVNVAGNINTANTGGGAGGTVSIVALGANAVNITPGGVAISTSGDSGNAGSVTVQSELSSVTIDGDVVSSTTNGGTGGDVTFDAKTQFNLGGNITTSGTAGVSDGSGTVNINQANPADSQLVLLTDVDITTDGDGLDGNVNLHSDVEATVAESLTIDAGDSGLVTFFNDVGQVQTLGALTVTGDALFNTLADNVVNTNGDQTYNGTVTIDGANADSQTTLNTGAKVVFNDNVEAATDDSHKLKVDGQLQLNANIGDINGLKSLEVTGATSFNGAGGAGSVDVNTLTQKYGGVATLNQDTNLTGNNVTFDSAIDGNTVGNESLVIDTTADAGTPGETTFNASVGDNVALTSISVNETLNINGAVISTTLDQTFNHVLLQSDVTLMSGGNILIDDTLNSATGAEGLTIDDDVNNNNVQNVTFDGEIGDVTALANLTQKDGQGSTQFNAGGQINGDVEINTGEAKINTIGSTLTTNITGGDTTFNLDNGATLEGNLNATAGKVSFDVNQAANSANFAMGANASLMTTNASDTAVKILVNSAGGDGDALLGDIQATGGVIIDVVNGGAGGTGQITDNNNGTANITAAKTSLVSGDGIGHGNALETSTGLLSVENQSTGDVRGGIEIDNDSPVLEIGSFNGIDGVTQSGVADNSAVLSITSTGIVNVNANVDASGVSTTLTSGGAFTLAAAAEVNTLNGGNTLIDSGATLDVFGDVTTGAGSTTFTSDGAQKVTANVNTTGGATLFESTGSSLTIGENTAVPANNITVVDTTGGDATFLAGGGDIQVESQITNATGDITFDASGDLNFARNGNGHDVITTGAGARIFGNAGIDGGPAQQVNFTNGATIDSGSGTLGDANIRATDPGSAITVATVTNPSVQSDGVARLRITINDPDLQNAEIFINWGDRDIAGQSVILYPPINNSSGGGINDVRLGGSNSTNGGDFNGGLVHEISYQYRRGNPDTVNPFADIIIQVIVRPDSRAIPGGGEFGIAEAQVDTFTGATDLRTFADLGAAVTNGIILTENGQIVEFNSDVILTVPTSGLFAAIDLPDSVVQITPTRIESRQLVANSQVVVSLESAQEFLDAVQAEESAVTDEAKLFFTEVFVDGSESEPYELDLSLLKESKLEQLFKTFRNGLYKIQFKAAGAENVEVLYLLRVFNHKIVPVQVDDSASTDGSIREQATEMARPQVEVVEVQSIEHLRALLLKVAGEQMEAAAPNVEIAPATNIVPDNQAPLESGAGVDREKVETESASEVAILQARVPARLRGPAAAAGSLLSLLAVSKGKDWSEEVEEAAKQQRPLSKQARLARKLQK